MKMSFTDVDEKCEEQLDEKSSDSEEAYQTEEECDTDESVSKSLRKLQNISIKKNERHLGSKIKQTRNHTGRLNVSLRYSKHSQCAEKHKFRKYIKRKGNKKCTMTSENCAENTVEVPQKGKRCRLGGKAKGMPLEEESCDKGDSDEETDSCYFSRISLGYFQKFNDKSGASTSYQLNESKKKVNISLPKTEELSSKTSEELELLELQQWGMTSLVSSGYERIEKMNRVEDIRPHTF